MTEPTTPELLTQTPATATAPAAAPAPSPAGATGPWAAAAAAVLAALAVAALVLAWNTQQRLKTAELEIVKRQQDAGSQASEARTLARQAEALTRESAAKLALLEARVAETTLQRSQLEDLIQSLSRSRDENILADVDAAIRVALQYSAITGSVEPLAAALRQADERLARFQQPRLERVRRAVAQDLERVRAASVIDLPSLSIRIDDAVRLVDELPLLATVDRVSRKELRASNPAAPSAPAASGAAEAASAAASGAATGHWPAWVDKGLQALLTQLWGEVRGLVRVARVDDPDAALLAPDQVFFLRENLKLRLLNARLALQSRQFDIAQADLRDAQASVDRYFDRSSRRVVVLAESLRQVSTQARQLSVPRPEATLAALAAVSAGR